jgi:phospholipid/cholesterol/gamma-HCH transport system substrate-binding protein
MERRRIDIVVGLFCLLGLGSLAVLFAQLGRAQPLLERGYVVYASFTTTGGLKTGSTVEIAGVAVGRVVSIELKDYRAWLGLKVRNGIKLQDDAIVSIRTRGLIGERFVTISPGGSDRLVKPGERLRETEDPIDLEELISRFIMGKV